MRVGKKTKIGLAAAAICALGLYLTNASWLAPAPGISEIVAHRGVHQTYSRAGLNRDTCTAERINPVVHTLMENTIPSIRTAFDNGATIVEIDIHPTTDGRFAVFHDWTLDCRTNGKGVTREQTIDQLKSLDIGYGYSADGSQTFPLRGRGISLMPSLSEVLDAFPDGRFLINFKSKDPEEGSKLVEFLKARREAVENRLFVYGGESPTRAALQSLPELRGFTRQSLKACALRYLLVGWSSYVPQVCRDTMLVIPSDYAPYLWGWPNRFVARMRDAGTPVFVAGPMDANENGIGGIDDFALFRGLGKEFSGGIWTNRIELIGPLVRAVEPTTVSLSDRFELRSRLQTNLYHLLLNWAWFELNEAPPWAPSMPEKDALFSKLTNDEQARWRAAVQHVASQVKGRSVLFDDGMIAVRDYMAGARTKDEVPEADLAILGAVEAVTGLYEQTWWPAHRAQNQAWITALLPTLRKAENMMTRRLAAAYGGNWPESKLPIDVAVYTVPNGAYSTAGRVTISSKRKGYEMPHALEMVLHEASHLSELEPALRTAIDEAFNAENKKIPDRLWHDVIFFTSGEIANLAYESIEGPDRVPYRHYGEVTGVYERGKARWEPMLPVLTKTWAPFVHSGSDDREKRLLALRQFARQLPAQIASTD